MGLSQNIETDSIMLWKVIKEKVTDNRPLARPWECSQSGGENNIFFYMRIDLNSHKRKFLLFCPLDWLHSHDVQGGYCFLTSSREV